MYNGPDTFQSPGVIPGGKVCDTVDLYFALVFTS